ncbi:MAG: hypothetical protein J0M15_16305 [Deltaproteobacteria bacterium]|nr:hypothetical protein [Deltaproteobacteria bacterium]
MFIILATVFSSLFWVQVTLANGMRVPGVVSGQIIRSHGASDAMSMSHQPSLCSDGNGNFRDCQNKQKYEWWKRNQGQAQDTRNYRSWDGQTIIVNDQSQDFNYHRPQGSSGSNPGNGSGGSGNPSGNDGGSSSSGKKVNLGLKVTIKDPISGSPVSIDTRSMTTRPYLDAATAQAMAIAANEVMSGLQRAKNLEAQNQVFQNYYNQTEAVNQAIANHIKKESERISATIQNSAQAGFAEIASGLLIQGGLSTEEIQSLKKSIELSQSVLRYSEYYVDSGGRAILEKRFQDALAEKNWLAAGEMLEEISYAQENGQKDKSSIARKWTNPEGVFKVGSSLDSKRPLTSKWSENGQVVRRVINRFQSFHKATEGLKYATSQEKAQHTLGVTLISVADEELARGNALKGSAIAQIAGELSDGLMGLASGFSNAAYSALTALPEIAQALGAGAQALYHDPQGSWDVAVKVISQLDEVGPVLLNSIQNDWKTLESGSAFEKGEGQRPESGRN